jgi:hypothetical protein
MNRLAASLACLALTACAREPRLTCADVMTGSKLVNSGGDPLIVVDLNAQTIAIESPLTHETVRVGCDVFAAIDGLQK